MKMASVGCGIVETENTGLPNSLYLLFPTPPPRVSKKYA